MIPFVVNPVSRLKGEISLSGDKAIAHRSIIISALTPGSTRIENFPINKDCLATLEVLCRLGVKISKRNIPKRFSATLTVTGKGLFGLKPPSRNIFVGDSGTTLRLILGVLAGQNFTAKLFAGSSLTRRPMLRVTNPLRLMGAKIKAKVKPSATLALKTQKKKAEEYPPLAITGENLNAITYRMPVASAQVKSAILLAALYAKGKTTLIEPVRTRDHTERMLKLFKADLKVLKNKIVVKGNQELISPKRILIPGDISSASVFVVLGTIILEAQLLIRDVCLNPSRTGILGVLKRMKANIKVKSKKEKGKIGEPIGDILVKSSKLKATRVTASEIPSMIDELPILMVAACFADGETVFEGISELRVKETDRIRSMCVNLRKMGAKIIVTCSHGVERIRIQGIKKLNGAKIKSFGDHRTAMSMVVAGLAASKPTQIDDVSCISKSFPDFLNVLNNLMSA